MKSEKVRGGLGRPAGEGHYRCKYPRETVLAMRADRLAGRSYGWIANRYGCPYSTAVSIANGSRRWVDGWPPMAGNAKRVAP